MSEFFTYDVSVLFFYKGGKLPVKLFRVFQCNNFIDAVMTTEESLPEGGKLIDVLSVVRRPGVLQPVKPQVECWGSCS